MFVSDVKGRLDRAVLLVVDMQKGFDLDAWPTRWNDDIDANGLALIEGFRGKGLPIIHVRHDSIEPGSVLAPGHDGNGFRPGFGPKGDEPLISKSVNSAFVGTDLDLRLKRLKPSAVVVFGISTDMCVSTTTRHGANLGWPMLLVADACDCFDLPDGAGGTLPAREVQRAHVATLAMEFCDVVQTKDLVAGLGN